MFFEVNGRYLQILNKCSFLGLCDFLKVKTLPQATTQIRRFCWNWTHKSSISLHLTHHQLKWCHYKNVPTVWPHLNCELNIIGAVQNVVGGREERYLLLHPEKILINTLATCRHCCVCGNLIFGCVQKRLRGNLGVNANEHVYRVQCRTRV